MMENTQSMLKVFFENDQNQDEGLEEVLDQMEKTQVIQDLENI
jgi:hypothetical protein